MVKENLKKKNFYLRYALHTVVFITGACSLIIEVVAIRILAPYFGNTIYTVSSVIGVVLAALSLGYYIGGIMADRRASFSLFYKIILVSGVFVVFIQTFTSFLLPTLAQRFSIIQGPLILSILLFFFPSFFLGMLSPFAIRLIHENFSQLGVGKITGEVFFWSTLGSILGSLLSGFVLIPRFGTNQIIIVTGLLLLILGFFGAIIFAKKTKKTAAILLVFGLSNIALSVPFQYSIKKPIIYHKDGVYEKIAIYDSFISGRPARFLQQDRSASGAMFLDSDELVYEYTKYYSLYKLFMPEVKKAAFIGGGAYSMPKALFRESPEAQVDIVEIEPSLFELAKQFFRVPRSSRFVNHIEDGRHFLYKTKETYDLIFSDVYYSLYSVPLHFTTKEFFELVRIKLSSNGIFIANLIGNLSRQSPSLILSEMKTFQSVFPNSYFFAVESPDSLDSQNIIFLGLNRRKKIEIDRNLLKKFADPIIGNLDRKLIRPDRFELSPYPILTDGFAPVEYLTAQVLKKNFVKEKKMFSWEEALETVSQQLRYGPRFLTSTGHAKVQSFISAELETLADEVVRQKWQHQSSGGQKVRLMNIIGRFFPEKEERIIIATHYDTKRYADKDPQAHDKPVPGANDGASGVAILLEFARIFSSTTYQPSIGVDLVFFDGEEGEEDLSKTAWFPLGSDYFSKNIQALYPKGKPREAIVVDMVCDRDLQIFIEKGSNKNARQKVEKFWDGAAKSWPKHFSKKEKYRIRADHTPFIEVGIPAFLIIDFDYPYFHTVEDTLDKCNEKSLEIVGNAILKYIYSYI